MFIDKRLLYVHVFVNFTRRAIPHPASERAPYLLSNLHLSTHLKASAIVRGINGTIYIPASSSPNLIEFGSGMKNELRQYDQAAAHAVAKGFFSRSNQSNEPNKTAGKK